MQTCTHRDTHRHKDTQSSCFLWQEGITQQQPGCRKESLRIQSRNRNNCITFCLGTLCCCCFFLFVSSLVCVTVLSLVIALYNVCMYNRMYYTGRPRLTMNTPNFPLLIRKRVVKGVCPVLRLFLPSRGIREALPLFAFITRSLSECVSSDSHKRGSRDPGRKYEPAFKHPNVKHVTMGMLQ